MFIAKLESTPIEELQELMRTNPEKYFEEVGTEIESE